MHEHFQVGKSATTYEPLSEFDVQNIDHQIKLYVTGALPDLEVIACCFFTSGLVLHCYSHFAADKKCSASERHFCTLQAPR